MTVSVANGRQFQGQDVFIWRRLRSNLIDFTQDIRMAQKLYVGGCNPNFLIHDIAHRHGAWVTPTRPFDWLPTLEPDVEEQMHQHPARKNDKESERRTYGSNR